MPAHINIKKKKSTNRWLKKKIYIYIYMYISIATMSNVNWTNQKTMELRAFGHFIYRDSEFLKS